MNTNRNAEKIRRRKQHLKQINAELSSALTKKRPSWSQFLLTSVLLIAVLPLIFIYIEVLFPISIYRNQAPVGGDYENLMLPITLVFVVGLLLIMWFLPKFYVKSLQNTSLKGAQSEFDREKEKLKLEDDTRKTLAQIIGGAVFLFGIIFTYNTFVLNREGQITDRFTKAVEQLGNKDIAVKLGGLYALERIAKDSPKDHWTVMEILSTYVREKSLNEKSANTDEVKDRKQESNSIEIKQIENEKVKIDVQAALTIIGRRKAKQDLHNRQIDLSKANLSGANLSGANLSGANLSSANLSSTNLSGADLSGADLNDADLNDAHLSGANLSGANLRGADISDADLNDADLSGANLSGADISDANLNDTKFIRAKLIEAKLVHAKLISADFFGADLRDADLTDTDLRGVDLRGAYLSDAKGLTFERIETAIISEHTKLPEGIEPRRQELLEISKKKLEEREKRSKEPGFQ